MLRIAAILSFALLLPSTASAAPAEQRERPTLQERIDGPYVALLELDDVEYSADELQSFKADVERHRDRQVEACKNEKKSLEEQLETARENLKDLNKTPTLNSASTKESRRRLHSIIAGAEKALRNKQTECEAAIPAAFEIKLAKLRLVERWPERRLEILRRMETGRAHERRYGDVQDIGYRKPFDGQEKDVAIGEQAVRQMKSTGLMPLDLADTDTQERIRRLAQKIALNSDVRVPLHVTVVESPEINTLALPGGFLFLTSGLIEAAPGESELAGILAHEIAHIAARHGARASRRSGISSMFVQAAQVATGVVTGGVTGAGAVYGINYGFQGLGMLVDKTLVGAKEKYQKEADQLAIQYAWKAGFDPRGFVAFLDSISAAEHSKTASFFHTHPHIEQRLLDTFAEIQFLGNFAPQGLSDNGFDNPVSGPLD
jgi:hypothetical protein